MLTNGKVSILDEIELSKARLEGYIACGMKSSEILTIFRMSSEKMDEWCKQEYGMDWKTTFELVRQATRGIYLDAVMDLGVKGNPTALSIIDKVVNNDSADEVGGMVFNVNVRVETDNDKECGGKD